MLAHNSSNETQFYPNGQLISSTGKNNFYLPVSEHDHKVNCNFPNTNHSLLAFISVSVQYLIYSCILGLISCSVFLRINYELKMVIMLTAVVVYNIIILHTHSFLLDEYRRLLYKTERLDR